MRRFLLLAILAASSLPLTAQRVSLTLAETHSKIVLTFPTLSDGDNISSFTVASGGKSTRFVPKSGIVHISSNSGVRLERGIWDRIEGLKLDSSRFFFVGTYPSGTETHTLLFFVGLPGIGAAPVFVLGFTPDGKPFKVLEKDELDVLSFEVANGTVQIVGKPTLSEIMGANCDDGSSDCSPGGKTPYATTYDPSAVYLVLPAQPAVYSLDASRRWNQQHYVWAGPHMREDYAVFYNIPGHSKPLGAPASRCQSILSPKASTKPKPRASTK